MKPLLLFCLPWFSVFSVQAAGGPAIDPAKVEARADVPFLAEGRSEKLDLYLPKNRKPGERSPAVLLIHGGGWKEGDKAQAREVEFGTFLAENGFVAASVNYALRSAGRFPVNLQDCKNGIRYLRAHAEELGVDPARIAVMGGSAGGHLALMVAYTADDPAFSPDQPYPGVSDQVRAVVDFYGITDIGGRKKTDPEGKPTGPRGMDPEGKAVFGPGEEEWKKASPIAHVRRNVPPTLIIHGKKDTTVDRDQSQLLADALKKAGAEVELVWLQKAGHSFSLRYENPRDEKGPLEKNLEPVVLSFLKKHLR